MITRETDSDEKMRAIIFFKKFISTNDANYLYQALKLALNAKKNDDLRKKIANLLEI